MFLCGVMFRPIHTHKWYHKLKPFLNRGNKTEKFVLTPALIGKSEKVHLRDLWLHKELGKLNQSQSFDIPKHGIVVVKVK